MQPNNEKMLVSTNIMDIKASHINWIGQYIPLLLSDQLRLVVVSDTPIVIDSCTGIVYDTKRTMNLEVVNYIIRKASEQIEVAITPYKIISSGLFTEQINDYLIEKWYEDNNDGEFTRETKFTY